MTRSAAGDARAFAWLYGLRLGGAAAAFVATAMAARILGPETFGAFALLLVIARLTWEIAGPALDTTMIRFGARALADDSEDENHYFRYVVRLKLALAVISIIVGSAIALPLSWALFADRGIPLWAILVAFLCGAILLHFSSALAILQARQQFAPVAGLEAAHSILRVAAYAVGLIGLPMAGVMVLQTAHAAIALHTIAAALICGIAWYLAPRRVIPGPVSKSVSEKVNRFVPWVVVACAATSISQAADLLILATIDTPGEHLGHYRSAVQLVLVGELAMATLFQVLLPKASELNPDQWDSFLRRNQWRAAGLSLVGLLGIPFAPLIVYIAFGVDYAPAASILAILVVGMAFVLTSAPAGAVLYAAERPRVIAVLEITKLVVLVIAGYFGARLYGVLGMAVAVASTRALIAITTFSAARRAISQSAATS